MSPAHFSATWLDELRFNVIDIAKIRVIDPLKEGLRALREKFVGFCGNTDDDDGEEISTLDTYELSDTFVASVSQYPSLLVSADT